MTTIESISLIDRTARFHAWGSAIGPIQPGWVSGCGWETKICSSEEIAWSVAADFLAGMPVQQKMARFHVAS